LANGSSELRERQRKEHLGFAQAEEYFSCHDNRLPRLHCDMKDKRGSKRCEVDSLVYWREGQDRVAKPGMSKLLARLELYRQVAG